MTSWLCAPTWEHFLAVIFGGHCTFSILQARIAFFMPEYVGLPKQHLAIGFWVSWLALAFVISTAAPSHVHVTLYGASRSAHTPVIVRTERVRVATSFSALLCCIWSPDTQCRTIGYLNRAAGWKETV